MTILNTQIERLISFGLKANLIDSVDIIYIRNQYLELFELSYIACEVPDESLDYADEILDIIYTTISNTKPQLIEKLGATRESVECRIINVLMGHPSHLIRRFNEIKTRGGFKIALDYWYQINIANFYIKMHNILKNQHWLTASPYGQLEITINLSKPEKDPREIAKSREMAHTNNDYPQCLLCIENEGFSGDYSRPARQNLRLLPLTLNNSEWFFQFSPYSYYQEHSIIINKKHIDMKITGDTFNVFFDFVDLCPHYIIGSNADLPIVGGSILTHDHYQAGAHIFPLEKAGDLFDFKLNNYKDVKISVVKWPVSTVRLIGNRSDLFSLSKHILNKWRVYSDPECEVLSHTDNLPHNTITPIMRKLDDNCYRLDLLLRNNRTSPEHPYGIFHPHENLHHIKKENIGLIEAMGLAILPGRLDHELAQIKDLLLTNDISLINNISSSHELYKHKEWMIELFAKYSSFDRFEFDKLLKEEIGKVFIKVLEDAGVFKNTPDGINGIKSFLESL